MGILNSIQSSTPLMALKIAASRLIGFTSARTGHSGTTLPGRLLLKIDAGIIGRLCGELKEGALLVSATNGKTTTSAMIGAILEKAGKRIVRNREGANLAAGVASALLKDAGMSDGGRSAIGVFEVDEAAFPGVAMQCSPRAVLLMNLFRDQLDRYGELEHIADIWRGSLKALPPETASVLNADDPLVASMLRLRQERSVTYGIEDEDVYAPVMQHASDSINCPLCGAALDYEGTYIGHLGRYACSGCENRRPSPTVYAENVKLDGMAGSGFDLATPAGSSRVRIQLPGLYNVYNALAAAAACFALDISVEKITAGLNAFSAAFGRVEKIKVDGKQLMILLVKNPAGFNEVVRTLSIEQGKKKLLLALNDRIADGRDISWIWDVDMELLKGATEAAVCSGTRAQEIAMRLKYAGVGADRLFIENDLLEGLRRALMLTGENETLYVLPTYTAMLAIRQLISQNFDVDRALTDLVWR